MASSADPSDLLVPVSGQSSDEFEAELGSAPRLSRRNVVRAAAAGGLVAAALACYAGWTSLGSTSKVASGISHSSVGLMAVLAVAPAGCGSWTEMCEACGQCCGAAEATCIEPCTGNGAYWQCKSGGLTPTPPPTKEPTPRPLPSPPSPTPPPTTSPPTPSPKPGEYHVGYYCIGHVCLNAKSDFGADLQNIAIHAGSFKDATDAPPDMTGINPGQGNYLVLGGDSTTGTLDANDVADWAASRNYQGVDFDMEGYLHADSSVWNNKISPVIKAVKAKFSQKGLPEPKFQMTVYTEGADVAAQHHAELDRIGYMTYGNCMNNCLNSGGEWDWCLPCDGTGDVTKSNTAAYIAQIATKGVPKEKTVLAMTYCGLAGYQVNYYKSMIKNEGYKGLTFWNGFSAETVKCAGLNCVPKLDFGNSVTMGCITDSTTQCSDTCNPSSVKCPCPGHELNLETCVS